jgi:peptidoglycan/xylan/chitin deacetylase (PgdA/CDA1 family)
MNGPGEKRHMKRQVEKRAIPILTYHQLTPRPPERFVKYALTPRTFARQMKLLAVAGYHPISLDEWLTDRSVRDRLPVIISFDDGFKESIEHAIPVLRRFHFSAIFFVVAGLIGKTSAWLARERGIDVPLLGWDDAKRLQHEGFEIGSHTLTHPHLAELPVRSCYEELRGSRAKLEDGLGRPIRHLAYPFGSYNKLIMDLASESGYVSACTTGVGLSSVSEHQHALSRVPVVGGESLLDFAARLLSGHSIHERRARVLQRFRALLRSEGRGTVT